MKARFVRRRTAVLGGALLVGLLVVAGGAEAAARHVVGERVEKLAGERLGSGVEADYDGWALVGLARGKLGTVTLHADDAGLAGFDGVTVDAELRGLTVPDENGRASVSGSSARAEVPADALRERVRASGGAFAAMVGGVEPRPADGTLRLVLGTGGLGQADIRPELRHGTLHFTLAGAKMLGIDAPKSLTGRIESALDDLSAAGTTGDADPQGAAAALGLEPTAVTVTEHGLRIDLKGGTAELDDTRASGASRGTGVS
ncbi:hypothetical protein [Streptomyces sp. AM 2-1-1]|uniref:hypothetical protein n=1 Tax=Streptomyces sp. AM 2-1-1 TaxID=3028709 RepID=UPI0023B8F76C|nr:hypothetical protein [Streptomyces sp. AM 2-1-1]WEH40545.1 hypothetical protein PZB77_14085 [Streptomyces sp. AM 2-1-1]